MPKSGKPDFGAPCPPPPYPPPPAGEGREGLGGHASLCPPYKPMFPPPFIPRRKALLAMKTYKIAAIPGDGIGKEVIAAGIEVLHALAARDGGFAFAFDHFDWGSDYYKPDGGMM